MACTSLVVQKTQPMYFALLDVANGSVASSSSSSPKPLSGPGVRGLQSWIETAWEQGERPVYKISPAVSNRWLVGYDDDGAKQLGNKLVGTRKWIGAAGMLSLCLEP